MNEYDQTNITTLSAACLLLCGLLITFMSPVHAGKIYQWVDENGKKHFSQTPPPELKQKKTVIDSNTSASSIRPVKQSNGVYCGELQVSYDKDTSYRKSSKNRLAGKVSRWQDSLKSAEKRLNDFVQRTNDRRVVKNGQYQIRNSSTYIKNKQKYTKRVNEYRCALGWAKNSANPDTKNLEDDYLKAKEDYDTALNQQTKMCGEEPPDYNKYGSERDLYKQWEQCNNKNKAVVRRMKSKLRTAEREYRNSK